MITIEAWISRFCAWWLESHGWYVRAHPPMPVERIVHVPVTVEVEKDRFVEKIVEVVVPAPPLVDPQFVDTATELAAIEEAEHPEPGQGEVKRHRVYAQMIKRYPDAVRGDLALAIELALRH